MFHLSLDDLHKKDHTRKNYASSFQKKWFNVDTCTKRNWSLADRRRGDVWEISEMQNSSTQLPTIVKKQKALMSQKMCR
jgi:hypothetical protein